MIYPDFGKSIVLPRTAVKDGAGNLFDSEVRVEPCNSIIMRLIYTDVQKIESSPAEKSIKCDIYKARGGVV